MAERLGHKEIQAWDSTFSELHVSCSLSNHRPVNTSRSPELTDSSTTCTRTMGARTSRRLQPADKSMDLGALPPELLVQVLSHVPPHALVTRCRPVCRAWRNVVDGPTVWLLQLARDRSAQGRALYAVAQRCPPDAAAVTKAYEELPLCALARYCLLAPLGRNLIFNSCGERGFRGWEVEHGGNGWAVEKNVILVPGAPSQTCFVTSFEWCFKRQVVDLVMEGVWQELLDSAQIEICVADWWGARENCSCVYRLRVRLLDVDENEVVKFSASPDPVFQWTEKGCRQLSSGPGLYENKSRPSLGILAGPRPARA
ncbi:F-box only protein 17 isoform X2 [Tenrec ecaudatus]|uniref:F-box only protein 17 isoform X2 n=1 Tax=Tenrec ecaudatus TaxID=94439 RepID=UPI003F595499